jgi:large subunit ribosomal protein L13
VIDGKGLVVGRLATRIAMILMGKHKPTYTPHVACGDCVVVVNAHLVRFSGAPMAHESHPYYTAKMAKKEYEKFSGYPGGRRVRTGQEVIQKDPTFILHEAVRRMLPRNKLRDVMLGRLKLYAAESHPHQAQQPQPISL